MRRWGKLILCVGVGLLAAGCPKGRQQYDAGLKAETLQDYDTALQYYQKALASEPNNSHFRIKLNQIRFEAGEFHIKKGLALREKGVDNRSCEPRRGAGATPNAGRNQ